MPKIKEIISPLRLFFAPIPGKPGVLSNISSFTPTPIGIKPLIDVTSVPVRAWSSEKASLSRAKNEIKRKTTILARCRTPKDNWLQELELIFLPKIKKAQGIREVRLVKKALSEIIDVLLSLESPRYENLKKVLQHLIRHNKLDRLIESPHIEVALSLFSYFEFLDRERGKLEPMVMYVIEHPNAVLIWDYLYSSLVKEGWFNYALGNILMTHPHDVKELIAVCRLFRLEQNKDEQHIFALVYNFSYIYAHNLGLENVGLLKHYLHGLCSSMYSVVETLIKEQPRVFKSVLTLMARCDGTMEVRREIINTLATHPDWTPMLCKELEGTKSISLAHFNLAIETITEVVPKVRTSVRLKNTIKEQATLDSKANLSLEQIRFLIGDALNEVRSDIESLLKKEPKVFRSLIELLVRCDRSNEVIKEIVDVLSAYPDWAMPLAHHLQEKGVINVACFRLAIGSITEVVCNITPVRHLRKKEGYTCSITPELTKSLFGNAVNLFKASGHASAMSEDSDVICSERLENCAP